MRSRLPISTRQNLKPTTREFLNDSLERRPIARVQRSATRHQVLHQRANFTWNARSGADESGRKYRAISDDFISNQAKCIEVDFGRLWMDHLLRSRVPASTVGRPSSIRRLCMSSDHLRVSLSPQHSYQALCFLGIGLESNHWINSKALNPCRNLEIAKVVGPSLL